MLLGIGRWGGRAGTGGRGIYILVSKGGGLAPPERVLRGGGGAPYFRAKRGRIETNRSGGGGGVIRQKYGEEEDGGTMMKIMVRVVVVIPHTPPLPPHNLRATQMLRRTQKTLMIREDMG